MPPQVYTLQQCLKRYYRLKKIYQLQWHLKKWHFCKTPLQVYGHSTIVTFITAMIENATIGPVFCINYTRPALHYRSIYPMPTGFYNLFASLYMVRNLTIYICVFTNKGVGEILQNYAIQVFNHLNEIPYLEVQRYIICVSQILNTFFIHRFGCFTCLQYKFIL